MLDFTSALYLGMRHPVQSLRPWEQLTTGKPAALETPTRQRYVAQTLANLVGCERATLGPSTLHLFWDLFGVLRAKDIVIYLDAGAYPIVRWCVQRAVASGVPVRLFRHHDAGALERLVKQHALPRLRPLVVADGFCPGCGKHAPIADYLCIARSCGGSLILDDTQALGIFGHSQCSDRPYGRGGGGSLRWSGVACPDVVLVSSLAKGFGAPLAMLAGSRTLVKRFEVQSETRIHSSPPSLAAVHAAEHALAVNRKNGEALRWRLSKLVRYFRKRLEAFGLATAGGPFPVQTLRPVPGLEAEFLYDQMIQHGVRTVLHRSRGGKDACLSFLVTARHNRSDIDTVTKRLLHIIGRGRTEWETPAVM